MVIPRHEFVDPAIGPSVGDALKGVGEPDQWTDLVHSGRRQQGRDVRPCSAATIAAGEQVVLARNRLRSDRALDGIGIDFDPAVGEEALECAAPRDGIADRFGKLRFARQFQQFLPHSAKSAATMGATCPGAQSPSLHRLRSSCCRLDLAPVNVDPTAPP